MLSRRTLLRNAGRLAATAAAPTFLAAQTAGRRPNVVIILADDQGWGDLSIHGNKNLSTPHIDSLAGDGALFDRFYVCPVCSPTRAEFLTGRYHARGGVRGVSTGAERLNLDEMTIAQTFAAAGYRTAAFGKWHNGTQFPYHPNARGFQEYYGFTSGHWGQYFDPELDHNGKMVRGKGYITDDLTSHALDFMTANKDRPFFCYLPFNTPHSPMQVPDKFYEKFGKKELAMRARNPDQEEVAFTRAALAMCESIDWNVGRVLARLDELRLRENTIVLYFSDNGPNSWRWNAEMKGRKGAVDEGGVRSPLLMRWPGKIPGGRRIAQIAGAIDLLPTLAEMANVPVASKKPLDGKSLKPLLMGDNANWPDRMIFSMWNKRISVRTQQYRLDAQGALFDMVADPRQDRDISKEKPEVAAKLKTAVAAWAKEVLPLVGADDRPYPVGYHETTMLPARDGVGSGGVKRSASAPNCSYFTNWTTKDGRISWEIEVGRAGTYEAVVYYTCPSEDVGSTIELAFHNSRVEGKISVGHNPPLMGAESDRVSRGGESYVKNFKPLSLGKFDLAKGRGPLVLRALQVPGKQVADIRYVALHLK
ncbi:MAG: arylsulfatase [Acidobacteria bacterium]|nr:arylsulfatase [Acidobacteriota bacterium]